MRDHAAGNRPAPPSSAALLAVLAALLVAAPPLVALPGRALVLDTADPVATTEPPFEDPAWRAVGQHLGGPSVIYLGYGWVLTANHVGAGIMHFDGVEYDPIAGTLHRLENVDGSSSDLLLFRMKDPPDLPPIRLAQTPPRVGETVTFIAWGMTRGEPLTIDRPPGQPLDGFQWESNNTRHWGTNDVIRLSGYIPHVDGQTFAFATRFERIDDPRATEHEAQGAVGDSGGGAFTRVNPYDARDGWQLSGVIFTISHFDGQPGSTSFYGDTTYLADVSHYHDQIVAIARPECANGLDDDGDGGTDYPADTGCITPSSDDEARVEAAIASPGAIGTLGVASLLGAIAIARLWRVGAPTRA